MKKINYTVNGNKYDVAVGDRVNNKVEVTVNGVTYNVETGAQASEAPAKAQSPAKVQSPAGVVTSAAKSAATGSRSVKAPLPGTIREICVAVGDKVQEGQKVIILEAMKMENNIDADVAGTVTAINVSVGDNVMADDVMITIE